MVKKRVSTEQKFQIPCNSYQYCLEHSTEVFQAYFGNICILFGSSSQPNADVRLF